jgi:hypothetical protein
MVGKKEDAPVPGVLVALTMALCSDSFQRIGLGRPGERDYKN